MSVASLKSVADVFAAAGVARYEREWTTIDQARVNRFADATDDHQWIHVDAERAGRESPFGGTVAHGFLTLSLVPMWLLQCVPLAARISVNYGMNLVRFISPVRVGVRLRAVFAIDQAVEVEAGSVQVTWLVTVECEGAAKPACVAEFITRHAF
ncbi:MaoC family protein [Caballeronia turbans]|jgi:acyl dehydratase|uniref:MaoC family dehydratase n=1 Tax=Caballeronia sp. INML2 TaxID=2921748 RepID=UPI00074C062A|nr:MaoC family dehydratase [Caballeronia sp. INML2]SAL40752.1 MaoC family protein [Caballeronia turbans]